MSIRTIIISTTVTILLALVVLAILSVQAPPVKNLPRTEVPRTPVAVRPRSEEAPLVNNPSTDLMVRIGDRHCAEPRMRAIEKRALPEDWEHFETGPDQRTHISFLHPASWKYWGSADNDAGSHHVFCDQNDTLVARFYIGEFNNLATLFKRSITEQSKDVIVDGYPARMFKRTVAVDGSGSGVTATTTEFWLVFTLPLKPEFKEHKGGDDIFFLWVIRQNEDFQPVFEKMVGSLKFRLASFYLPRPRPD